MTCFLRTPCLPKNISCKASILALLLLFTPPPCLPSACVREKGPCQQREPLSNGGDRRQSGRRREGKKGRRETVKRDGGEKRRRRRCCCPRGDVILIPSSSLLLLLLLPLILSSCVSPPKWQRRGHQARTHAKWREEDGAAAGRKILFSLPESAPCTHRISRLFHDGGLSPQCNESPKISIAIADGRGTMQEVCMQALLSLSVFRE